EITELISRGIVQGYPDNKFAPDREVTRSEFAILLTRAMGYEDNGQQMIHNFDDLSNNAWYSEELNIALNNVVTKGFNDNTYRPNEAIKREQAAIMISNVILKELGSTVMTSQQFR
ncbi:S-layer homology domain-containing protein, partial [Mycobacterium tuberculosis]|uniref:S-layer homology domain-containing protein n=1 Tax=Mycobacterium tuberculosis TaxID=1773 RepID=UPI0011151715